MKKLVKVLALMALSVAVCLGVFAFAACGGGETYEGDYHYSQTFGTNTTVYGIKVKVTVADGKITKVEKVNSDYVEVTTSTKIPNKWDDAEIANWNDNLDSLLAKYKGMSVETVKGLTCSIENVDNATTNSVSDKNLIITGATQGSARVLKAVQDALKNVK